MNNEPTNQQKLDQIPMDEIIEYAMENFFDEIHDRVVEAMKP